MENIDNTDNIVLFDGYCILCNRSVDFLLKRDKKKKLKFALLPSAGTPSLLPDGITGPVQPETIIFLQKGRIYTKSTAVLKIMAQLKCPYPLLAVFLIIPVKLRDWVYDLIAKNRYRWFGRRNSCRVPDEDTKDRFIWPDPPATK